VTELNFTFRRQVAVIIEALACQIRNTYTTETKKFQNLNRLCLNQVLLKKTDYTLPENNHHCSDGRTNDD